MLAARRGGRRALALLRCGGLGRVRLLLLRVSQSTICNDVTVTDTVTANCVLASCDSDGGCTIRVLVVVVVVVVVLLVMCLWMGESRLCDPYIAPRGLRLRVVDRRPAV